MPCWKVSVLGFNFVPGWIFHYNCITLQIWSFKHPVTGISSPTCLFAWEWALGWVWVQWKVRNSGCCVQDRPGAARACCRLFGAAEGQACWAPGSPRSRFQGSCRLRTAGHRSLSPAHKALLPVIKTEDYKHLPRYFKSFRRVLDSLHSVSNRCLLTNSHCPISLILAHDWYLVITKFWTATKWRSLSINYYLYYYIWRF